MPCGNYGILVPEGCAPADCNCSCTDNTRFDSSKLCRECLPGFYGPQCDPIALPCTNKSNIFFLNDAFSSFDYFIIILLCYVL